MPAPDRYNGKFFQTLKVYCLKFFQNIEEVGILPKSFYPKHLETILLKNQVNLPGEQDM